MFQIAAGSRGTVTALRPGAASLCPRRDISHDICVLSHVPQHAIPASSGGANLRGKVRKLLAERSFRTSINETDKPPATITNRLCTGPGYDKPNDKGRWHPTQAGRTTKDRGRNPTSSKDGSTKKAAPMRRLSVTFADRAVPACSDTATRHYASDSSEADGVVTPASADLADWHDLSDLSSGVRSGSKCGVRVRKSALQANLCPRRIS